MDLVSKYPFFTFPFCQTCLPIEAVVPSSLPCINNVVLMLYPLFPECSSSQFKSSFVSLVVIDVVPIVVWMTLLKSLFIEMSCSVVGELHLKKRCLLLVSCHHWFAYVLFSSLSVVCLQSALVISVLYFRCFVSVV